MSLNGALNASVSGLRAQSAAVAAVSENIANASTTAYKTREISFKSLVTGNQTGTGFSSGGVIFNAYQDLKQQGQIQAYDSSTFIAINGNGFFVVTDEVTNQPSGYTYTRNGSFSTDAAGFLVNSEGYYLLGQRTDDTGAVVSGSSNDLNSLEPIDVNQISGTAQSTTTIRFDMNLPADAPIASTFSNSIELFDALGVSHTVSITWLKNAANDWTATFSDPVLTSTGAVSGTMDTDTGTAGAQTTIGVTFNGDGSVASFTPAIPAFDITGFTTGANNSSVSLDWGTVGQTNGLTQFSSNTTVPGLEIFLIDQDGVRFGQLSEITIDETGLVTAAFENGVRLPVYQIPIATFPNPGGLKHVEGTVYDENEAAGNYNLRLPGQGNAGNVIASALEQSTTDTSEEFNKMIVAQQAYSSAAQVVSTVDQMFQDLISAVR
ncbi:MAG TPA: flagellar hook protein FlgE [Alphaproteobacteria bacterium]|jgi:flagellar hook protein FlgE|nr:flagellar hook protein FlgE [Alphaproteobacteria bacterium]